LIGTYQFKTPESTLPGTPVGRIKASDADVGENAEIEYSITDGEGLDMFDVITDQETQEGVITVKKVKLFLTYLSMNRFTFLWFPNHQGRLTLHINIALYSYHTNYFFKKYKSLSH
jgi:hypothetical protein